MPAIQREVLDPEEEPGQTKRSDGKSSPAVPIAKLPIRPLPGAGYPLPQSTRSFFEQRFGTDFINVRVHTDSRASHVARSIHSRSFTLGEDIVFGAGEYAPHTVAGRRLLGHELTHVVQQGGGRALVQRRLGTSQRFSVGSEPGRAQEKPALSPPVQVHKQKGGSVIQRAMLCSKRLNVPVLGWLFNHAYVDDTGRNDCLGRSMSGNLAIQELTGGNFLRGCAIKTDTSTDPQSHTPNMKRCDPKPGIGDVSACLRQGFAAYTDPSYYANPSGPNSNTFVGTLARACCADASWRGLGWVPGWNHSPAGGCTNNERQNAAQGQGQGGGAVAKVQPRPFTGTTQGTFMFSFRPPRNPELGKAYVLTLFFKSNGKDVAADVQFRLIRVDDGIMYWESTNPEPVDIAPDGDPPKVINVGNSAQS